MCAGTACNSDAGGDCKSEPVTPAPKVDGCTVDVCFLLDDSGSLVKVSQPAVMGRRGV